MISISLPLPPTGLRAPGSSASAAPPGDFSVALADMLTGARPETDPAVLPAVPAGRQVAAVPGKSLPADTAADAPIGAIDDNDMAPAAPEAVAPTPAAPIVTPSIIEKAPVADVPDHAPSRHRTHIRSKEKLAALPLPIPAAIAPPMEVTAVSKPPAAHGAVGESRSAAGPAIAATPDQSPVPTLAMGLAAAAKIPSNTTAVPRAARPHAVVAASISAAGRGNGETTAQGMPIPPSLSQAAPQRPARFHDARIDADASKLATAEPVITNAETLAPNRLKEPGATTTESSSTAAGAPSQAPARTGQKNAAPMIGAAPKHESAPVGAGTPRGGADEPAIAAQLAGSIVASASEIAPRQEPAPAGDGGVPRRAAANRVSSGTAPATAENLGNLPPVLARTILAERPATDAGSRAGSNLTQADVPARIETAAAAVAGAARRRFQEAPVSGSEPRRAQAASPDAQPVLPDATPTIAVRDSAAPATPASAIRTTASLNPQPAPTMPLTDTPAPCGEHVRQVAADGIAAAPVQPAMPGPRPIALAPVPPAAAPIAAMFGGAQPLGPRAPKPVERTDAPTAIPSALATTHAVPIQPVAEAQRTPLDMRRDDWTQKLSDRIETIRDAANATDTRIKLMPDALGKIDVSMRKNGDTVHVAFTADVPATRAMLADAQPRLAELAQQRGLRLGQASVDAGTSGDGQQRQAPAPSPPTRAMRAAARDEAPTETGRVA